jgi:GntR family transcriptional regulator
VKGVDCVQLDPSGVVPVYYQLKELLRREISAGGYAPGAQIPSEHQLMRRFGVSRATVRQALGDLVVEGLLKRRQGKGTFVAEPKLEEDLGGIQTFNRQMAERGLTTTVKVLSQFWLPATTRERELFGLAPEDRTFRVMRLISVQSEPVFIESWVFFNEILRGRYHLPVDREVKYLEPAVADEFEASQLGIRKGQPVLLIERISYPPSGDEALFTCKWTVRGDRCRHMVRVGDGVSVRPGTGEMT